MLKAIVAITAFAVFFSMGAWSANAAPALCSMQDGQPVDGTSVLEKQGKKYEFCCAGCLRQFKEAPEKFASEMESPALIEQPSPEATCSTVCSD